MKWLSKCLVTLLLTQNAVACMKYPPVYSVDPISGNTIDHIDVERKVHISASVKINRLVTEYCKNIPVSRSVVRLEDDVFSGFILRLTEYYDDLHGQCLEDILDTIDYSFRIYNRVLRKKTQWKPIISLLETYTANVVVEQKIITSPPQ